MRVGVLQYNLPRWQDLTVSRAGMYDDTFTKTPTQGWMVRERYMLAHAAVAFHLH